MSGKLVSLILIISAVFGGISLYYLQVYYYYSYIDETSEDFRIKVLSKNSGLYETVKFNHFEGINGDNSPLKFKSCFNLTEVEKIKSISVKVAKPVPLTAPAWFSCFNAKSLGKSLESGEAFAVISEKNIFSGIDRVLAFYNDGRAFSWHQLTDEQVRE